MAYTAPVPDRHSPVDPQSPPNPKSLEEIPSVGLALVPSGARSGAKENCFQIPFSRAWCLKPPGKGTYRMFSSIVTPGRGQTLLPVHQALTGLDCTSPESVPYL